MGSLLQWPPSPMWTSRRAVVSIVPLGLGAGMLVLLGACRTPWIGPYAKDTVVGCTSELSEQQRSSPSLWIRFYTPKNEPVDYTIRSRTYGGANEYYEPPSCDEGEPCLDRVSTTPPDGCVYVEVGNTAVPAGHVEFTVVVDEEKYAGTATGIRVDDGVEELGLRVYRRPRRERRWWAKTQGS